MNFQIMRIRRHDWKENEATWNVYKTGSNWGTGGGDYSTPLITIGALNVGWQSPNVLTIVTDAWTNRGGICTFGLDRDTGMGPVHGWSAIPAKDRYVGFGSANVHHLRISYTLDGRTFQAMLR